MACGMTRFSNVHSYNFEFEGRVGVPQFMAPEIVRKDRVSCSSDIWSSGVVLFLLLAGRLPFSGSTSDIYERIMQTDVDVRFFRIIFLVAQENRLKAKKSIQHSFLHTN